MSSYVLPVASSHHLAKFAPRPSMLTIAGRLLARSRQESGARRLAAELMALSDRQLLDIGIGRDEIAEIARCAVR